MICQLNNPSTKLDIDIDQLIITVRSVVPELWEHMSTLTESIEKNRGQSAVVNEESLSGRIKYICRTYLMSMVLFLTIDFNSPFLVVLAVNVESCGGSTEII